MRHKVVHDDENLRIEDVYDDNNNLVGRNIIEKNRPVDPQEERITKLEAELQQLKKNVANTTVITTDAQNLKKAIAQ